jgi:signal transduction histidine kinase/DNA-binding NarL/FixJ family response regulator
VEPRRLLFVDDDPDPFDVWGKPLTNYGWDVVHATSPVDAKKRLQEAEDRGRPFDAVIIDREMPDPKTGESKLEVGDELLKDITARWRYVCPIMLTNHRGEEAAAQATRHGAYRYLLKGIEVKKLDRICRKGVQMQLCKRIRHSLLYPHSLDDLLHEVKESIAFMLTPQGYCVAYLEIAPGGALLIGDYACEGSAGPLTAALERRQAFLDNFPSAQDVKNSGRYRLRTKPQEIKPKEGVLLDSPGSQLIVPIMEAESPKPGNFEARKAATVVALIWIESTKAEAFDHEDGEMLTELADFVGIAFAQAKTLAERGAEGSEAERNGLLSEVAHRICNPLQIAQSNIDLLAERLRRTDTLSNEDLRAKIEPALAGIVQAIQAADQLRQGSLPRTITLRPALLAPLVREVADSFQARADASSSQIKVDVASGVPMVSLDLAETRYILNCILENALEAIQKKKIESGFGKVVGLVEITLGSDPETTSVLLSVRDNGCGIEPARMSRVFERYFSTKDQDFRHAQHGLGLWEAKRFVEAAGGTIQARSDLNQGTVIQIILPACDEMASTIEISL